MFDGLLLFVWFCSLRSIADGSVVSGDGFPLAGPVARTTATLCCPSVLLAPWLCPLPKNCKETLDRRRQSR